MRSTGKNLTKHNTNTIRSHVCSICTHIMSGFLSQRLGRLVGPRCICINGCLAISGESLADVCCALVPERSVQSVRRVVALYLLDQDLLCVDAYSLHVVPALVARLCDAVPCSATWESALLSIRTKIAQRAAHLGQANPLLDAAPLAALEAFVAAPEEAAADASQLVPAGPAVEDAAPFRSQLPDAMLASMDNQASPCLRPGLVQSTFFPYSPKPALSRANI